jgi:diguanylate cyclase (GGDEF)-like protein
MAGENWDESVIAEIIMNEIDDYIYISDIETSEVLYMNRKMSDALCYKDRTDWQYKLCRDLTPELNRDTEEEINGCLLKDGQYAREVHIKEAGRYFSCKYKLVAIGGRKARLCLMTEITEQKKASEELKKQLQIEETLVECIRTLNSTDRADIAINRLLSIVADYHAAERAYIFEFHDDGIYMDNTYEWCKEGIEPQIQMLQNTEIALISRWFDHFDQKGEFYITSLSDEVDKSSGEYELLQVQGIDSLMAAPLRVKGRIVGFIGVDNPTENVDSMLLMQSVTSFILDDIQKRKDIDLLYELSYHDLLTKVGNRHAYVRCMTELEQKKQTDVGILFADINGLKPANDQFGHERGDAMIIEVADILKDNFDENIFRIGGDEFVVFVVGIAEQEFYKKVETLKKHWPSEEVTASLGYTWTQSSENLEAKVAKTDRLMYESKEHYYTREKNR